MNMGPSRAHHGSDSDWSVMVDAAQALAEFEVPFEVGVVSAHRTPADARLCP